MALRKLLKWLCAFSFVGVTLQSFGTGFDNEHEKIEKNRAEIDVQLPAFPGKENLIPFKVGSVSDTKYLIDGNSVSLSSDGVIRFVLVIESSAGVQNISYEGMRCTTAERRYYAFGRSDKTWSKARSALWGKVQGATNNHHAELYNNYFCVAGAPSLRNAEEIRRVLRKDGQ
jgi:hypothetical protein